MINFRSFRTFRNISRGSLIHTIGSNSYFFLIYRHHFKNILYCGEPDEVVDEYMKHYNGESGTYFSFLPVHHKQSAGYECLLGAIEMGYIGKTFL